MCLVLNTKYIIKLTYYVEKYAKELMADLNNDWNPEKVSALRTTLGDWILFNEREMESVKEEFMAEDEPALPAVQPKPKKIIHRQFKGRVARGTRAAIIDLILNDLYEKGKTGQTTFVFKGADFGVSEKYIQRHVFNYLNTCEQKTKRFPDLNIKRRNIEGGVLCSIEPKTKRS